MYKIAVIIPVFKGRGIIDKCLKKLREQQLKPDEIICIDDSSPDNSANYIKNNYNNITVFRNIYNIGAAGTYAVGLYYAYQKGYEWFWLLDQDNSPEYDALKNLFSLAKKYVNKKILFSSTLVCPILKFVYFMKKDSKGQINPNKPYFTILSNFSGLLIHRKAIEEVGFPLIDFTMDCADWEYILRLVTFGWKIIINPKSIVYHFEGTPILKPAFYKTRYYRLKNKNFIEVKSKWMLISNYPKSRYFSKGKNSVMLLKLYHTPNKLKIFLLFWILKKLVKIILIEPGKKEKMEYFLRGISSGIIKNVTFNNHFNCKNKSINVTKHLFLHLATLET